MSPRVTTLAIDDPGDLLARLPSPDAVAWVRHGDGLVGWGEARRIAVSAGPDRFCAADEALRTWFAQLDPPDDGPAPVAFGSFTFDPDAPGSWLTVPAMVVVRRRGVAWVVAVDAPPEPLPAPADLPSPTRVRYAGSSTSELDWLEAVAEAAATVRSQEPLEKVVLARDLHVWSAARLDPRVLARRLAERFDGCWTFLCAGLVGATPELLIRRMGDRVQSLVLAGSAARGRTRHDDDEAGASLLGSKKDRVEHELAVASVVDILRGVTGGLEIDDEPTLLRLANVQHLATSITGTLEQDASALALAGLLHPTAAVCGTPTDVAMGRIRDTEGLDRGRYGGPVGWVDARGDGEFGIALRCAEVDDTRARLFTGAGIVAESLPELELEETRLKLRAMQSALEGTAP